MPVFYGCFSKEGRSVLPPRCKMEGTNMNAVVVEFIEKYVQEKSEKQ
ncbi:MULTISPECIES: hypothetical protein [Spirulina sp. CCY15215]|nr:hypothetical protein [Spirulina major]